MAATPKFNALIIEASHKLHDPRTDASPAGDPDIDMYSSVLLQSYENRAIRDLIRDELKAGDANRILSEIPEYVKTTDELDVANAAVLRPDDCWLVADVYVKGSK